MRMTLERCRSTSQNSSSWSNWGHYRPGWSLHSLKVPADRAPPAPARAFRPDTQILAEKHLLTLMAAVGGHLRHLRAAIGARVIDPTTAHMRTSQAAPPPRPTKIGARPPASKRPPPPVPKETAWKCRAGGAETGHT